MECDFCGEKYYIWELRVVPHKFFYCDEGILPSMEWTYLQKYRCKKCEMLNFSRPIPTLQSLSKL